MGLDLGFRDWVFHPGGDDLAICKPTLTSEHEYRTAIQIKDFLTDEIISKYNIGPGDDTYLVGRFVDHQGTQSNTPSVRFGNVAMMPGEPILLGDGHHQEAFLIESRSVSGYSGAPVFVHIPMLSYRWQGTAGWAQQAGPWLLGIDRGHLPFEEAIRDSIDGTPSDRWYVPGNAGMMVVIPSWRIRELLETPIFQGERERQEALFSDRAGPS